MKTKDGTKTCRKCGGRGTFQSLTLAGNCYPCNGTGRVATAAGARAHAADNLALALAYWRERLAEAEQLIANPFVAHPYRLCDARRDAENARRQLAAIEAGE